MHLIMPIENGRTAIKTERFLETHMFSMSRCYVYNAVTKKYPIFFLRTKKQVLQDLSTHLRYVHFDASFHFMLRFSTNWGHWSDILTLELILAINVKCSGAPHPSVDCRYYDIRVYLYRVYKQIVC